MGDCEVDAETLRICGYREISSMMVGDGQGVSINLINLWKRITVTAESMGGEGSALGRSKMVTVWGVPGEEGDKSWRYDLNINYQNDEIVVLAIRTSYDKTEQVMTTNRGEVVALDPPNEMEMLAALGKLDEFIEEDAEEQEE